MIGRLMALLVPVALVGSIMVAPAAQASETHGLVVAQAQQGSAVTGASTPSTGTHKMTKKTTKKHKKSSKGGGGGTAKHTTKKHKKSTKSPSSMKR